MRRPCAWPGRSRTAPTAAQDSFTTSERAGEEPARRRSSRPRGLRALAAAGLLAGLGTPAHAARHPTSFSRTRVLVHPGRVDVSLALQATGLLEALCGLDADGDGALAPAELEAGREEVAAYLLGRLRLFPEDAQDARPLAGGLAGLGFVGAEAGAPPDPLGWIEARLSFSLERPLRELTLENRLFLERNPTHRDFTGVAWEGEDPVEVLFGNGWQRETFAAATVRRPAVLLQFLRMGIEHILTGYDHLAFLVALIVASRRLRSLLVVVSAFTVAHSLTLAAAALGVVSLPSRAVELGIALSIAYVACDNLLQKEPRTPWIEAFVFGLLHGLGFAGFLKEALAGEPLVLSALFGFNLGVEIGQLAVVVPLVALFALVFRRARGPRLGLVPRPATVAISAVVAAFGFLWFFQRTGWLA